MTINDLGVGGNQKKNSRMFLEESLFQNSRLGEHPEINSKDLSCRKHKFIFYFFSTPQIING